VPKYAVTAMGANNAEIINNVSVDLLENSYGKDYLKFSDRAFEFLSGVKRENYELIYGNGEVNYLQSDLIEAMFERLYERLLEDLEEGNENSYIFRHHLKFIDRLHERYKGTLPYREANNNQIVTDYLASMTDDYFVDLHAMYFPEESAIKYTPYFKGAS
jgi:dGTPase